MKTQTLPLLASKEEVFSKFGVNFLVKNGKVYLLRSHYCVLIENDATFFKKLMKTCEKTEFGSFPYPITEKNWQLIKKKMRSVTLYITLRCNSECNVCFMKDSIPYSEMKITEIKQILAKIGKNKQVVLQGGEPTTRKDIFKIINLVKKSGNIPILYTNGLKLADSNYVKMLKKSGVDKVHVSFDGFREEVYEKLRGDSKQLYIKLRALKNLEKYNIKVSLAAVIASGINEDEVEKLLRFSIKNNHFIKALNLYGATPYGKFNIDIKKYLTPSDLIKLLGEASNGVICKEYFVEFKKLRVNLYNILKNIGIYFPFGDFASVTLFKVHENEIKHFIPLEDIKSTNKEIEKGNVVFIMKQLFKSRGLLFLKLMQKKIKQEVLGSILNIHVANINTPVNYIPIEFDNKIIAKIKDEFGIFEQAG